FEAHHMFLVKLQLGRVFDRRDELVLADVARHHVYERRLVEPGATQSRTCGWRAPVPPLIRAFRRARTQWPRKSSIGRVIARYWTRSSPFSRSFGKRRIESSGPSTASGARVRLESTRA